MIRIVDGFGAIKNRRNEMGYKQVKCPVCGNNIANIRDDIFITGHETVCSECGERIVYAYDHRTGRLTTRKK
ncbi:MAG: hypothetical protein HFI71_14415 [Lachnospiraceae bacterium]|jgi:hypothetical protein|nr:hypothetical protein [Lachnospiraceae bacterium]